MKHRLCLLLMAAIMFHPRTGRMIIRSTDGSGPKKKKRRARARRKQQHVPEVGK